MQIQYTIIFLLSVLSNGVYAQNKEDLKQSIHGLLLQQQLAGAIWTTVTDKGEICTDVVGYKNKQRKELLSSTDMVLVGSVAKTMLH